MKNGIEKPYEPHFQEALTPHTVYGMTKAITNDTFINGLILKQPSSRANYHSLTLQQISRTIMNNPEIIPINEECFKDVFIPMEQFGAFIEYTGIKLINCHDLQPIPENRILTSIRLGDDIQYHAPAYTKLMSVYKEWSFGHGEADFKDAVKSVEQYTKFTYNDHLALITSIVAFRNKLITEFFLNNFIRMPQIYVHNKNYEVFDPTKDYNAIEVVNGLSQGDTKLRKSEDDTIVGVVMNNYKANDATDWDDAVKKKYIIPYNVIDCCLPEFIEEDGKINPNKLSELIHIFKRNINSLKSIDFAGTSISGGIVTNSTEQLICYVAPTILDAIDEVLKANTYHNNLIPGLSGVKIVPCPLLDLHYYDSPKNPDLKKDVTIPPIIVASKDAFRIMYEPTYSGNLDSVTKHLHHHTFYTQTGWAWGYNSFKVHFQMFHKNDVIPMSDKKISLEQDKMFEEEKIKLKEIVSKPVRNKNNKK